MRLWLQSGWISIYKKARQETGRVGLGRSEEIALNGIGNLSVSDVTKGMQQRQQPGEIKVKLKLSLLFSAVENFRKSRRDLRPGHLPGG
jgi:hypothetical protein